MNARLTTGNQYPHPHVIASSLVPSEGAPETGYFVSVTDSYGRTGLLIEACNLSAAEAERVARGAIYHDVEMWE